MPGSDHPGVHRADGDLVHPGALHGAELVRAVDVAERRRVAGAAAHRVPAAGPVEVPDQPAGHRVIVRDDPEQVADLAFEPAGGEGQPGQAGHVRVGRVAASGCSSTRWSGAGLGEQVHHPQARRRRRARRSARPGNPGPAGRRANGTSSRARTVTATTVSPDRFTGDRGVVMASSRSRCWWPAPAAGASGPGSDPARRRSAQRPARSCPPGPPATGGARRRWCDRDGPTRPAGSPATRRPSAAPPAAPAAIAAAPVRRRGVVVCGARCGVLGAGRRAASGWCAPPAAAAMTSTRISAAAVAQPRPAAKPAVRDAQFAGEQAERRERDDRQDAESQAPGQHRVPGGQAADLRRCGC